MKVITLTDKHLKNPIIRKAVLDYFNKRIMIDNPPRAPIITIQTDCLKWTGGKQGTYGTMYLSRKKLKIVYRKLAHIVSYMLFKGEVNKSLVLHLCQEDLCVNPDHLILGSAKLNAHHAILNRINIPPLNRSWKLSTTDAKQIRIYHFKHNYSLSILAQMFNVTLKAIADVIHYKTFKI